MSLNSYLFIFAFLPVTILIYYLLNHFKYGQASKVALFILSLVFYALSEVSALVYIFASIGINFAFAKLLQPRAVKQGVRKTLLVIGLALNIISLLYYKYAVLIFGSFSPDTPSPNSALSIIVPLGISYITFQQIAYLVDSYRGETNNYNFLDYAVFITYFPKILAGPIVLHNEMITQLNEENNRQINTDNLAAGLQDFVIGLFKKVILAQAFSEAARWGFTAEQIPQLTSLDAALVMLSYTFQIYFDFSGYSDMALGISKMLNINLPANFNSPYKATSILDFWERWHISLTSFLRRYIYFPLGGSRKGKARTYLNILIIFLISGIWHGANITFLIWGAVHGFASIMARIISKRWNKLNKAFRWFMTFLFINLTWVIFRADSLSDAWLFFTRLFSFQNVGLSFELAKSFTGTESTFIFKALGSLPLLAINPVMQFLLPMVLIISTGLYVALRCMNCSEIDRRLSTRTAFYTSILFVWSVISLAGVSSYIYAGF